MASLNTDCWMSKDIADKTSSTQVSLLTNFLGWQKVALITSKCFLKLSSTSDYNQYYEYTTPTLSMTPWESNLLCNFATRKFTTPTNPSCDNQFLATKINFKIQIIQWTKLK
jgi:hypothetical protein